MDYKYELWFYGVELTVPTEKILWMHEMPRSADGKIGENNKKMLKEITKMIESIQDVVVDFNRITVLNIPEVDLSSLGLPRKKEDTVTVDICFYGHSADDDPSLFKEKVKAIHDRFPMFKKHELRFFDAR